MPTGARDGRRRSAGELSVSLGTVMTCTGSSPSDAPAAAEMPSSLRRTTACGSSAGKSRTGPARHTAKVLRHGRPDATLTADNIKLLETLATRDVRIRLAPLTTQQQLGGVAGAAWGEDGRIVFASGNEGLWSVSAQGGDVSHLVAPGEGISDFHDASGLPDGSGWLVVLHGPVSFDTIAAVRSDGSRTEIVSLPGERLFDPVWSPSGHVVFSRAGAARGVYAVPVKAGSWQSTGEPFLVAAGYGFSKVSGEGTLAMIRSAGALERRITLVDREGQVVRVLDPPGRWTRWPNLSPDGTRVLAELADDEGRDLWMLDTVRGTLQRFTDEEGTEYWGTWTADGSEIWYATGSGSRLTMRVRAASGIGEARDLGPGNEPVPAADGRWVFFTRVDTSSAARREDLWLLPLGEEGARAAKEALGWPLEPAFHVPDEVLEHMRLALARGDEYESAWGEKFSAFASHHPEEAAELTGRLAGDLPAGWDDGLGGLFDGGGPEHESAERRKEAKFLIDFCCFFGTSSQHFFKIHPILFSPGF